MCVLKMIWDFTVFLNTQPTMHYTVPSTGEVVKVYLFVATLPFSQYSYVEATKDMKMDT